MVKVMTLQNELLVIDQTLRELHARKNEIAADLRRASRQKIIEFPVKPGTITVRDADGIGEDFW